MHLLAAYTPAAGERVQKPEENLGRYNQKNNSASLFHFCLPYAKAMPLPSTALREGEEFTGESRVRGRHLYASTNQREVIVREMRGGRPRVTAAGKVFFV